MVFYFIFHPFSSAYQGSRGGGCLGHPGKVMSLSLGYHIETDNHSHRWAIRITNKPNRTKCMLLDCGRKAQHLERTHTEHENMQTPHRQATAEGGVELKTLLRGLNSPLCHLAVLIIFSVTYSSRVHKPIADLRRAVPIFFIQSLPQTPNIWAYFKCNRDVCY